MRKDPTQIDRVTTSQVAQPRGRRFTLRQVVLAQHAQEAALDRTEPAIFRGQTVYAELPATRCPAPYAGA